MAMKFDLKKIPPYVRVTLSVLPGIIVIVILIFAVYIPKSKEIDTLNKSIAKLENDIASGEVKIRRLEELKAENALLKAKLAELKQTLPEEKEVSVLLKQISDLSIKSGLEVLFWKPGARRVAPSGLYAEIPVQVEVVTGYHNLGIFYSHISGLTRIVNITGINIKGSKGRGKVAEKYLIGAKFNAVTFGALSPGEAEAAAKQRQGR
jgi:type IV pilus assembly protein PilO